MSECDFSQLLGGSSEGDESEQGSGEDMYSSEHESKSESGEISASNYETSSSLEAREQKKEASLEFVPKNKTNVKGQEHLRGVVGVQVIVMAVAVLVPIIHLTQPQQYPTKGRARQRLRHRLKQKLPSLASVSRHPRTVLLHLIGMLMLVNEPKKVKV